MAYQFILPDIGEGVVEAEIQQWFVKPGDPVREDQPLVEVMTDKATVTIPSPRRGRVTRLLWKEGDLAKVHQPLLEIEIEEAAGASAPEAGSAVPLAAPPQPSPPERGGSTAAPASPESPAVLPLSRAAAEGRGGAAHRALAAPAVRALARQLGVDLQSVPGTGPGGRVTKDDVSAARDGVDGRPAAAARPAAAPAGEGAPAAALRGAAPDDEVVPLRGLRRKIAEHMAVSKHTAAHFTFVEEVDVTELTRVKDRIAGAAREQGVKVTFLPFIVKAAVAALKKHPALNALVDEGRQEVRRKRTFHLGVAAATEQGLVVPVVRDADRRSLLDLAREIERLGADARGGKLRLEDLGGSSFTITSLGALGGLFATPIINHPEVAILGVHRIRPTPVARDGQVVIRDVMHVSLSFDHRIVDGHVGAAFAYTLIGYLEDPNLLFMELV
ncbi:dihydrolipoamide acetyltransferase family protein [Anaeromyxobacter paludicola]|uniref:Dihydrolipoamide acetyltransferase component of pyruvate dehydrogenase complex n=1 Tax=Anaeromyxobacter paludicola TaxID=2918171 RepID=A0ABM7X795_9BACT|nr:dihydrolipoamide acetyltransferase family protein [Anaeromyxobacter paludicola]BDG07708.1 dihydrolipoyllysine-residue acetyltransferase component of pyruvate dehydrogenase complex [Anaeromyxobacter paludicola]